MTQVAGLMPLVLFCLKTKKQFDLKKKKGQGPVTLYRDGGNCQLVRLQETILRD